MSEPINKPEDEEMDVEFNDVDDQIVPDELPEQTQKQDDQQPQQSQSQTAETKIDTDDSAKPQNDATSSTAHPTGTANGTPPASVIPELPDLTRKDKSLKEVLDLMDGDFAPIIPDAVTDYYLAKMDLRHRI